MNNKNEEVAALEALRDSSGELVKYLDAMNDKLTQLNQQNELSLRVLENWSSVIAITKATTTTDKSDGQREILRKALARLPFTPAAQAEMAVRANGFQTPLSRDQVTSWVLQPLMMGSFITFVAKLLDRDKRIGILVPTGVLILTILWCWYLCESRDPSAEKSKSGVSVLPVPEKATRYCTLCCKTSPGLDHHCTWLNTCIASNNYEPFYFLVIAATLQTMLQGVIGVLMATIWFDQIKLQLSPEWTTPIQVLLWVHNAIILPLANSYILLAGFHTYLLIVGSGTYDFILENGSDGICARLLKCKCLTKSKGAKGKKKPASREKRGRSLSKTTPITPSSKVVAATAAKTTTGGATRGDGGPRAQDLEVSAAKQREMEQWKAEWMRKYGSDDNEDTNSESAADRTQSQTQFGSTLAAGDATPPPPLSSSSSIEVVPAKRRGTNPEVNQQTHHQVQIEMSAVVDESEGIFQDIENPEVLGKENAPLPPLGTRTDL